jgi:hypothetical protein
MGLVDRDQAYECGIRLYIRMIAVTRSSPKPRELAPSLQFIFTVSALYNDLSAIGAIAERVPPGNLVPSDGAPESCSTPVQSRHSRRGFR